MSCDLEQLTPGNASAHTIAFSTDLRLHSKQRNDACFEPGRPRAVHSITHLARFPVGTAVTIPHRKLQEVDLGLSRA